jgi:hypothetical protein
VDAEVPHQLLQHVRHPVLQRLELRLPLLVPAELGHDKEAVHLGLLLLPLLRLARAPARAAAAARDACIGE